MSSSGDSPLRSNDQGRDKYDYNPVHSNGHETRGREKDNSITGHQEYSMNWEQDKEFPRDGRQFIGVYDLYPQPLVSVWCEASYKICVCVPQCGLYKGQWNDWYFEGEYIDELELIRWAKIDNE